MRFRQLVLVTIASGLGLVAPVLAHGPALAAPGTPMGASALRAADNPHRIRVAWKPVTGADHYVVRVDDGDTDTVTVVPATASAVLVDAPDPAAKYLVNVGARDAGRDGGTTGWMTVRSLVGGAVGGLTATRTLEDRGVATARWRVPLWTGYAPTFGYRTQLVRASDNATVADTTTTDLQVTLTGVDRAEKYTLNVTTVNEYGTSLVARTTISADKPGVPQELTAVRDNPQDRAAVSVAWKAPADLTAPPTHYMINYWTPGRLTRTVRVDAPATAGTLSLDPRLSWTVRVQAFNDIEGSAKLSNTVTLDAVAAAGNPDTIAPAITPTVAPALNRNGWTNTTATVSFTCTDVQSGVASCTGPVQVAGEGAEQTVPGTAVDYAGNATTKVTTVNIDKTAPTITTTLSPPPTADGWHNTPVTVGFTCADALSGIANCPAPVTVVDDAATRATITGTVTDKAGNTGTASVITNIDTTPPTITATVTGTRTPSGWYRGPVTVHYTCTDALSGIDICPADTTLDADHTHRTITATATDKAGNTATTRITDLDIDLTDPQVTVLGATNRATYGLDDAPSVGCQTTDAASGVAVHATGHTVRHDRGTYTTTCAGAVDHAGNTAAPVAMAYTVTPTAATLSALTHRYVATNTAPSANGFLNAVDNALDRGRYCDYLTRIGREPAAHNPNLTTAQAADLTYWTTILAGTTC